MSSKNISKNIYRQISNQPDTESDHSDEQDESDQEVQQDSDNESELMDTASAPYTTGRTLQGLNYIFTTEQRIWIIHQCIGDLRQFKCFQIKKMQTAFKKKFKCKDPPSNNAIHA